MSGLISSLQNSSAALRVHSKGLETVGKNLANINNPAYAKQRVVIGDRGQINTGIATEMMGVEAMELRQNRDSMLDKGVMRELNATSALEAAKHVLQSAETALGQFLDRTEDGTSIQNVTGPTGGGISEALTDFFNAWESFSVKPNDVAEKQLLIAKAQILADKFNGTDKRLNQVQLDADQQIEADLIVVNDLLNEIAEINDYIAKAENVKPFSAVDLRDQRQAKLEQLSKYVDVTFVAMDPDFKKSLGRVDVILNNGADPAVKLVDGAQVTAIGEFTYDSTARQLTWLGMGERMQLKDTPLPPTDTVASKVNFPENHGLATGDKVYFEFADGEAAPLESGEYYVTEVAPNTFSLSKTFGGAALEFTSAISPKSTFRRITERVEDNIPSGSLSARLNAANDVVADTRQSIYDLADQLQEEVNFTYQSKGGDGEVLDLQTTSAGLINLTYNKDLKLSAGPLVNGVSQGGNDVALSVAELGTKVYEASGEFEFLTTEPHAFKDGDKVYVSGDKLVWVADGVEGALDRNDVLVELGIPQPFVEYTVKAVTNKIDGTADPFKFKLTTAAGVYLDEASVPSPITTITSYSKGEIESDITPNVDFFIKELNLGLDFSDGQKVIFSDLPPDSKIDPNLDYFLVDKGAGKFQVVDSNRVPHEISETDLFGVDKTNKPTIDGEVLTSQGEAHLFDNYFDAAFSPAFLQKFGIIPDATSVQLDETKYDDLNYDPTDNDVSFKFTLSDDGVNYRLVWDKTNGVGVSGEYVDAFKIDFNVTPKIIVDGVTSQFSETDGLVTYKIFDSNFDITNVPSNFVNGSVVTLQNVSSPDDKILADYENITLGYVTVDNYGQLDPNGTRVYQFQGQKKPVTDKNADPYEHILLSRSALTGALIEFDETTASKQLTSNDVQVDTTGRFSGELILDTPSPSFNGQVIPFKVGQEFSFSNTLLLSQKYIISDLKVEGGKTLMNFTETNGDQVSTSATDFPTGAQISLDVSSAAGDLVSFRQINEIEGSFTINFNSIVTVLAQELNTTNIRLEDQELSEKMALESRDQYSGVSQDEEVTDMMKFQRSFQASARHINIIDTLLDQVVNRLGIG